MHHSRATLFFLICATPALPQQTPDIPKTFTRPTTEYDYVKREVMIPMRDGVKLHTVIVIPKGAQGAPILLSRTPYNADKTTSRNPSQRITEILPISDEVFA